ncbi:MAG: YaeQ family protein [Betaproteobacteria bacterium]|nr:YaeQ family protein [Betaproteobacteria bacterium]
MALKATIFKADLQIADMDRNHYAAYPLTLARHPSETGERMMVRLLAFALYADDLLVFGKGLSTDEEPDLWLKDLTGAIRLWINVGQPDERWLRKAAGRAGQVVAICYGGRAAEIWWEQNRATLERLQNLTVLKLAPENTQALARLANRSMNLQCTMQDGEVLVTGGEDSIRVEPAVLLRATKG